VNGSSLLPHDVPFSVSAFVGLVDLA
jgi:hypothetical protein